MKKAVAVANKILELAKDNNDDSITPMQLIKLVYLSHAWMLGLYGRPLIREHVQAWQYGPVIRPVYEAVKKYRDRPVVYPLHNHFGKAIESDFNDEELDIIRQVYEMYGEWDGITLSRLTHKSGSPWDITWSQHGQNAVISNDLIEHHYKKLYAEMSQQEEH